MNRPRDIRAAGAARIAPPRATDPGLLPAPTGPSTPSAPPSSAGPSRRAAPPRSAGPSRPAAPPRSAGPPRSGRTTPRPTLRRRGSIHASGATDLRAPRAATRSCVAPDRCMFLRAQRTVVVRRG
jgi:hypothetical protein